MEWLREFAWLAWLGAALLLGLVEISSLNFVFVMLTIGALGAAGVALLGGSFVVQVLVFAGISLLLLVVVRPIALRRLKTTAPTTLTNAAAYLGRRGEVLSTTTAREGLVKVIGEEWSARSDNSNRTFEPGEIVRVVRIEGAVAIVDDVADDRSGETVPEEAP